MRVLFLTLFESLGSSKVRVLEFVPYLERLGVRCTVRAAYSDAFYHVQMGSGRARFLPRSVYLFGWYVIGVLKRVLHISDAWRHDLIFIQKDTLPETLFRLLKILNKNIVYEFDDTISAANPYLKRGFVSGALLRYRSHLFGRSCALAAHVVAENSYLRQIAERYNQNVSTITAPVDTELYAPAAPKNREEVVLGWLGSPSTTYLIASLTPVFATLASRYPHMVLMLTGAGPIELPGVRAVLHPWSMKAQRHDLRDYDIGLMPLDDQEFNRGRLGYKMILYMSSGIPVAASAVGLNVDVVVEGENGVLARDEAEWIDKLSLLIEDASLRCRLGHRGREIACAKYERARLAERLLAVFENVIAGDRGRW